MDGKLGNASERRFIFLTKLESDDLYRKDMVEMIQSRQFRHKGGMACDKGYVLFCDKPTLRRRIHWEIGKLATKLKLK